MASESVERSVAEAKDARERVSATIVELQDRLQPRRLVGEAIDRVTGGGLELAGQARDAARSHPIAIAAAVGAVGLALIARRQLSRATVDLGDDLAGYTDYDDGFGFPEAPEADALPETAIPAAARAPRQLASTTGGQVAANPLAALLLGVAAGAAIGMVLPTTATERRALGETGGRLGAAARAAARRAAEELDSAGLGLDRVRSVAGDVRRKAGDAARAAVAAARDELKV